MSQSKHWYFYTHYECVLGGCQTVYKERRYGKKPKTWLKRHEYVFEGCTDCQIAMFL